MNCTSLSQETSSPRRGGRARFHPSHNDKKGALWGALPVKMCWGTYQLELGESGTRFITMNHALSPLSSPAKVRMWPIGTR